ncbi:MarR family transcriptional regulator [Demequina sp. SYSU T00192]|uniref:MarR family transcriptional regulator n=1 Tax=Demequina litoralis TaxID=3051660 RepID=A0ABT8GBF2_9MICO|nr:MarR family transcriptional regulator [Demequina sp. SYSU T00192]MDN4476304.1 MarR family transcriptional regulator [Demequina sp. SYSU T00192]
MTATEDGPAERWGEGIAFALWRAQQVVHGLSADALSDLGVTPTQMGLAVHLDELGPLSGSDLSRRYSITPQSVSTALGNLERLGWVSRRPHPVHGRVILYELTEPGLAAVAKGRARMKDLNDRLADALADAPSFVEELERLSHEFGGARVSPARSQG